jgi:hypothetical protein
VTTSRSGIGAIARNSWGIGWGENGMIRIKRGSGENGQDSVCGIAKSPSIALGGVLLLPASEITSTTNVMTHIDNGLEQIQRIETNLVYNHCKSIGTS